MPCMRQLARSDEERRRIRSRIKEIDESTTFQHIDRHTERLSLTHDSRRLAAVRMDYRKYARTHIPSLRHSVCGQKALPKP